ncbi:hypothetical protein L218DRAFT_408400 [Marasmius fiardii PR-910]|nr:hypothetical protein L218DRAFT_408400 [Marasmius fiardii PR-910]
MSFYLLERLIQHFRLYLCRDQVYPTTQDSSEPPSLLRKSFQSYAPQISETTKLPSSTRTLGFQVVILTSSKVNQLGSHPEINRDLVRRAW